MKRLKDVMFYVLLNIALWCVMVISWYAIKTFGLWTMFVGIILLGILEGLSPRLRKWWFK
jgi:hypothetical protein